MAVLMKTTKAEPGRRTVYGKRTPFIPHYILYASTERKISVGTDYTGLPRYRLYGRGYGYLVLDW